MVFANEPHTNTIPSVSARHNALCSPSPALHLWLAMHATGTISYIVSYLFVRLSSLQSIS